MDPEQPDEPAPLPQYDLHTHTVHCGHAAPEATVANMIARARELELEFFGISEHVFFAEESATLFSIEREMRQCDAGSTRVLLGAEIDPNPHKADGTWATHDVHVDYVILSPHMLPHSGIGAGEFDGQRMTAAERQRLGFNWLDWYERCIAHGRVDILGHPLREPMTLGLISLRDGGMLRRCVEVLSVAALSGVAFEINEMWVSNLLPTPQYDPYMELLQELHHMGMRFSRGSDAHAPAAVGGCNETAHIARHLKLTPADWLRPQDLTYPLDWEV